MELEKRKGKLVIKGMFFLISILSLSCTGSKWHGFVYKTSLIQDYELLGPYDSKDQCLLSARQVKASRGYYSFECGSNCEQRTSGMYVCDETVD